MHVDTMRNVDYWVGIPLCFVGTLIQKSLSWLPSQMTKTPSNILLIELSEMGSTILVDPAMQKLKRELNANLHFVIFKKNKPSLDLLKTVQEENIFAIREESLFSLVADTIRFLFWTRAKQIDTVIDLELFSRFTALLSGFSGAQRKVGFHAFYNEGLYRGSMLTHEVAYNPHQHISKNFIALVNSLLINSHQIPYSKTAIGDEEIVLNKVSVPPEEQYKMRQKIADQYPLYDSNYHHIVLFNANASDMMPLRRWDQKNYIHLAKRILDAHPEIIILLTGAPAEFEGLQNIPDALQSDRCINFAGKIAFSELVALYEISEFMLTNDSGPGHFSAVTSMPSFVFFGPETPKLYGSLGITTPIYAGLACSPCVSATNHRKSACNDNICMQAIGVDAVYSLLQPSLLKSRFEQV
ncbi:glycosyltransferase family 9 protein [Sulfuricurvum sp.]|uniref:glycosyltransferase family 9 protein n=1 Tax=Sulfuricurvum sp. TaxID=2025608 RepID=UPI002D6263C3|nr:glycosyltransferase family 9 protein [Sulfuricurvum sp.]HZF70846.1 glycosyltransferase family 9 protein [Sulfuricurvum sp.]